MNTKVFTIDDLKMFANDYEKTYNAADSAFHFLIKRCTELDDQDVNYTIVYDLDENNISIEIKGTLH